MINNTNHDVKIRTFVDANVLIRATNIGEASLIHKIIALLNDVRREFVANDLLELEVLPKPVYNQQRVSVDFCQDFFASCVSRVVTDEALVKTAYAEACRLGLSAADAIHLAAAHAAGAHELVTLEKPTKPMYKTTLVKVVYLPDVQ